MNQAVAENFFNGLLTRAVSFLPPTDCLLYFYGYVIGRFNERRKYIESILSARVKENP
jgi:hypothetical protein